MSVSGVRSTVTAQLLFVLGAGASAEVVLSLRSQGSRTSYGPVAPTVPEWLMAL